jgi:DNA (cytosine-5)-methyltransferase 1
MSFQKHRERHLAKGNGFGFCLCRPDGIAPTLTAHYAQGGSEILIPPPGRNPRRLTPRECSRLMGFDRSKESKFRIPVSDRQAWRQFGNAVGIHRKTYGAVDSYVVFRHLLLFAANI